MSPPRARRWKGVICILWTQAMDKAGDIFQSMGFEIADGPELGNRYYNFDAFEHSQRPSGAGDEDTSWLRQNNIKFKSPTRNA